MNCCLEVALGCFDFAMGEAKSAAIAEKMAAEREKAEKEALQRSNAEAKTLEQARKQAAASEKSTAEATEPTNVADLPTNALGSPEIDDIPESSNQLDGTIETL
jgi:hypothetical protein